MDKILRASLLILVIAGGSHLQLIRRLHFNKKLSFSLSPSHSVSAKAEAELVQINLNLEMQNLNSKKLESCWRLRL